MDRKTLIWKIKNCYKTLQEYQIMLWPTFLFFWGCIPEITKNCQDMTNASSTYLGIIAGAIIGGVVSWWIYNRQKKTAEIQESTLNRIKELDENHEKILKKIEDFEIRHETTLGMIDELSKKIKPFSTKEELDGLGKKDPS